jgi:hypothetical protein
MRTSLTPAEPAPDLDWFELICPARGGADERRAQARPPRSHTGRPLPPVSVTVSGEVPIMADVRAQADQRIAIGRFVIVRKQSGAKAACDADAAQSE